MSNKKLKFRKQVEKKKATRKKVLNQRKQTRQQAKERSEQERMQKQFQDVLVPYRKDTEKHAGTTPYEPVDDPVKVEAVKKRLEHNMKIIEALEQEMLQEEAQRKNLQEEMQKAEAVALDGQMKFVESKIKEQLASEEQ